MTFITKTDKMIVSLLFGTALIFSGILLLLNPGVPRPFKASDGSTAPESISEKTFVTIGGVKQGMFIRGRNINNPVLLYLHGGPAFPNYFLFEKYNPGLDDLFTVCYWEQRGGGLSYNRSIPVESMTFEQLTADALEVTEYLRKRFGREKIYIMAHSGGTPIAIKAVSEAPQLFHAYLAMAQITNQEESEKIAYRYMADRYKSANNRRALKELEKFKVMDDRTSIPLYFRSMVRDKSMHDLGIGTMRNMRSVVKGVFIPTLTCRAYTVREKIKIWHSKIKFISKTGFAEEVLALDIPTQIPRLEVPVYFFSGRYDLTVNADLARAYLEKLEAPAKGFYLFEKSAHSPLFEEPQRFMEIVEEIIAGTE